jgi:hypothetical protein
VIDMVSCPEGVRGLRVASRRCPEGVRGLRVASRRVIVLKRLTSHREHDQDAFARACA